MIKILLSILIVFVVSFLLCFPFWHVGGHYYRGLLLIYDIRPASGGGFVPPLSFERDITLLKWADPTSFKYVHGGKYYSEFSLNLQFTALSIKKAFAIP